MMWETLMVRPTELDLVRQRWEQLQNPAPIRLFRLKRDGEDWLMFWFPKEGES